MTEFRPFSIAVTPFGVAVPNFESNELFLIQRTRTASEVTKVKVGTGPSAVAYSEGYSDVTKESFIYVTNTGSNDVSVIDETNQVINTVKVGTAPSSITYFPKIHNIYVANSGSNDVTVIHEDQGAGVRDGPVKEWPVFVTRNVGTAPSSIAYNPNNNLVYVANSGSNDVTVIRDYNVATTIKVGTAPSGIAGSLAGYSGNVYVANSGSNDVYVIDGETNKVVARVKVGTGPSGIISVGRVACVANSGSNNISVIDVMKNAVDYTIQVSNPFSFAPEYAYTYLAAGIPMKLYSLANKWLESPPSDNPSNRLAEYPISIFSASKIIDIYS